MDIAASGNVALICKEGAADIEECLKLWEDILKRSCEVMGSYEYYNYIDLQECYNQLLNDYNTIKAILIKLCFIVDDGDIQYLRNKGYVINLSSATAYSDSIQAAGKKSDNIRTKILSKENELQLLGKEKGGKRQSAVEFGELVAELRAMNFAVDHNITLAEYNGYNKIIKRRNGRTNKR
jgi:hypothetical protein